MSEKEITVTKIKSKKKSKKSVIKWILIGLAGLILFIGFNYFKSQKLSQERREQMDEQRQVLIDSWQEQGLTEEEIKEKLDSMISSGLGNGQRPEGIFRVIQMVSGGHGPGRR
jgi:hypothetical protein